MESLFQLDFYPTPRSVYEMMNIDCSGKIVLEPQAGIGNIVKFLKESNAKSVIACEKNETFAIIAKDVADTFLCNDFFDLTREMVSHIDMIVMNPPFSNAYRHILHAFEIAPDGCEIVSLINSDNLESYRYESKLKHIIETYGDASNNLGECFTTAERKTNVNVTCIKLFKPIDNNSEKWDGFCEADEVENTDDGLIPYNEVVAIVNAYRGSLKAYDEAAKSISNLSNYTRKFGMTGGFEFQLTHNTTARSKSDFAKAGQIAAWKTIFKLMNIDKYVTRGVKENLNRFVEIQTNYPFTVKNVYRMIEIIFGTREQTFYKAVEECIDNFTKYTHENRFSVPGWKTNSGYMLNEKFIVNYVVQLKYTRGMEIVYYKSQYEQIDDLIKVLCSITGKNYDSVGSLMYGSCKKQNGSYVYETKYGRQETYPINYNSFETNVWYDSEFFNFKVFKKGTMHLKFKDRKQWEAINRMYAKAKGNVLPEKI